MSFAQDSVQGEKTGPEISVANTAQQRAAVAEWREQPKADDEKLDHQPPDESMGTSQRLDDGNDTGDELEPLHDMEADIDYADADERDSAV